MKTNAIYNLRAFHSRLTVAALAALFTLTTRAGAAPTYGLSFNGTSAYVETSTGVIPSSGDFTVEVWAACPTAPSTYKEILSQGSSGNAIYIGTDTANNILLGDGWGAVSPAVAFPGGGWHHFAVVKSSTNTIFYLDGTNRLARGSAMVNPAASTGLQFGCQYGGIGEYWPGSLGDVRVWSKALSATDISTSLTNQLTGSEANLVANWQFHEGAGTTCTSIGPSPVVGTLINGPVWIVPLVFALGTTNLTEGPAAGSDSVVLGDSQASASWTATANDSWLHVTSASGAGSTNVLFTFDANAGPARTGTLTIAGQTVTITQAGAGFVLAASMTTPVSSGLSGPMGVAVDGAGNVYIADTGNWAVRKWNPVTGAMTNLAVGQSCAGVAVDGAGNVYIADNYYGTIEELLRAFVCTTSVAEGATAGNDALPAVLPASQNLSGIFAPSSDQPWLTITGVANGVVSFSFTANTNTAPRTANITLLGQTIPITQSAAPLPPTIANWTFNASTQFQFQFTGPSNSTYTVLSTTNVALPLSNWLPLSPVIETSPGQYQFTDTNAPAGPQRFYLLRWP